MQKLEFNFRNELSTRKINSALLFWNIKIELTLMNSRGIDLACMGTKIDIHVPDDGENSGMKMIHSNIILGAMLLLGFF